ncbi:MAG: NFACT RNA binding domain-containing protein, partial [Myxococcota bacterium]
MLTQREFDWIVEELTDHLPGAIVQRIYERDAHGRVLQCRRPGRTLLLELRTLPELARLHFVDAKPKQPKTPTAFTMVLRKWARGMIIREVSGRTGDRIVRLRGDTSHPDWQAPDDDPEARPPRANIEIVVELLGRHANIFVLDAERRVLGMAHADAVAGRALCVHDTYAHPPLPDRLAQGSNRWEGAPLPEHDTPRSALVAAALEGTEDQLEEQEFRRETRSWLKREAKRLKRLVHNIERDLERAHEAQGYRRLGELLQSAYGKIERGASSVLVPDYYAEGMPVVDVPLDPTLDLQGNIDHYFKQYRRLHDALEDIESRLLEAMEHTDEVAELRNGMGEMEDAALRRALEDLVARGVVRRPRAQQRRHRGTSGPERKPYREFEGAGGATILVGRGGADNDALSLKVARGRDVWLHARDFAGAHVVLRMAKGEDIPQAALHDAAVLAAHFSKGRDDTLIDVTYTRAKHIRK